MIIKRNQWPIKPTFLSRLSSNYPQEPFEDDLNDLGIFTKTSLQGFLAVVTHDILIDNSAALIEFLPFDHLDKLQNEDIFLYEHFPIYFKGKVDKVNILLTDSTGYRELNPVCKYFRDMENCNKHTCIQQDSIILLNSLQGINKSNYFETINDFITKTKEIEKYHVELKTFIDRPYFTYICDITKFIEMCFPIFFEDNIVAVLIIGGILSKEMNTQSIKKCVSYYMKSNNINFSEDVLEMNIIKSLDNRDRQFNCFLHDKVLSTNADPLEARIKNIHSHINILESRIDKRINFHRYRYISENFKIIKRIINESIDNNLPNEDLASFHNTLFNSISKMIRAFPFYGFYVFFGVNDFSNPDILHPIASIGTINDLKKYYYDKTKVPDICDSSEMTITNFDNPNLVNGLIKADHTIPDFNPSKDNLRFFQTKSPKVSFIIWKQYEDNWGFSSIEKSIETMFTDALIEFYSTVALNYSIIWGKRIEEKLEDVLRVTGHETRQILLRVRDTLESNFKYQTQLQYLISKNIYSLKYDDLDNYLKLLNKVIERPSFLLRSIKPDLKDLNIYELLKNIKSLHLAEALHKDKSIYLNLENFTEHCIAADEALLMQVFYNLIDNAVKYSYNGSAIQILIEDFKERIRITFTSYGPQIEDSNSIYALYYRGKNVESLEDGLGIGMFVSLKIIDAHKGSLTHKSDLLSDFNVSCLEYYNRTATKESLIPDLSLRQKLDFEIKFLDFSACIAYTYDGKPRYFPRKFTFDSELKRKTYINKFYINLYK